METQSIGAENAPGRGDVKLQLEALEIPTGEPILPPPLDYNRLPLARLVHIDEAIGPSCLTCRVLIFVIDSYVPLISGTGQLRSCEIPKDAIH